METLHNTLTQLGNLIDEGREIEIITLLSTLHPADIADLIDTLEDEKKKKLFRLLDVQTASEVISEIDDISRELILKDIPNDLLTKIVDDMESDDATDLIADLPEEKASKILSQIGRKDSEEVQKLLKYSEDTAGGIMQAELISVNQDIKVGEALAQIRAQAKKVENLQNIFVTANDTLLVGILSLKSLILSDPDTIIAKIMNRNPINVTIDVDQEEVASIFKKYDFISLPVVNHSNKLVGQILVDDIIDVFEEEASEDILKMAGTREDELVYGSKILKISGFRLPWLITNLFGGIVTGYFLWFFKVTVKDLFALITFIPVITAMAGNVGIQTSTIMVRGIATKKIDLENLMVLVLKELKVGTIIGCVCGIVAGAAASFWHHNPLLGVVVGISMLLAIIFAAITGAVVPALFKKINIDPAVAAGPIVATVNDIIGILIYMFTATLLLKLLL